MPLILAQFVVKIYYTKLLSLDIDFHMYNRQIIYPGVIIKIVHKLMLCQSSVADFQI